ncbi:EAL domain-containing protein [Colwellia sp. MB02u-6]|uniref:EAL domain-containing protein n=1 Tax=Colwellia sp. MB02u-6 TaxID=2759824 RepID=UPI0015F7481E|nr:EAL domain-containing protein [Colwellia sp. MB02u-6]MBA6326787.1 EAL domain-containing protein [Colwellia sp. MB02u-6]
MGEIGISTIGMSVFVDDFGTGYSSLSYLKNTFRLFKIDHSFVKGVAADDNNKAIIGTIISMAHNLNSYITAEGLET